MPRIKKNIISEDFGIEQIAGSLEQTGKELAKKAGLRYIHKWYGWICRRKGAPHERGASHRLGKGSARSYWWGKFKSLLFFFLKTLVIGNEIFILSTTLCLIVYRTVNPPATTLMMVRQVINGWKVEPLRFKPLSTIPKTIRSMVIQVEDGNFYNHRGIILGALKNAYYVNQRIGAPVYGGSTITMQTARSLFLLPVKSYIRKYLEIIIALEMEFLLSKDRILELYFNYAEWGKGLFGIEVASRFYYRNGVAALSTDQAICLVTVLASPLRYTPNTLTKNNILRSRYNYLVKRFGIEK